MTGKSITNLKGVGEKRAILFEKLGVDTIDALLRFYPRDYEDFSNATTADFVPADTVCTIKATITSSFKEHFIRKGMVLYKGKAESGGVIIQITIFNNKFAAANLKVGEKYILRGKLSEGFTVRNMSSPEIIPAKNAYIRPIYRLTEGLPAYFVEKCVRQALSTCGDIRDPLPLWVREKYNLCDLKFAIRNIHFPGSMKDMQTARNRLVFEELLVLSMGMSLMRHKIRARTGMQISNDFSCEFASTLPFQLTNAQKRSISECIADMKKSVPMNRLIQGDVGSGKTAVAAGVMYTAAKNGLQSALMVPTEILAEQHYRSLNNLLKKSGIKTALLTGSLKLKEKKEIHARLKSGEIDVVIGTHALISETVEFKNLGLVITDEQHRFGVEQRSILASKGNHPHIMVMSATPIPRTLALMIYGDLDISVLDEVPAGRQKIETYAVGSDKRQRVYNYIKKHIDSGRQGYIVCPLVEENDSPLAAVEKYAENLQRGPFKSYRVGLIHGKIKSAQKDAVMQAFAHGDIDLLVSTTVIEVGVDVPNAAIIVIENAERFGLSQLHQLRGRVGRGQYKSTCILISDAQNKEAVSRLSVMCKESDGFKIADEDLKLRGPGDFFGNRQHGLPELKIADLMTDMSVLNKAQACAKDILYKDPMLKSEEFSSLCDIVKNIIPAQTN